MNTRNRLSNRWYRWVVLPVVLSLLLPMVSITPAFAQQLLPPLAEGQIVVVGLELRPGPEHQVVPKNQATSVRATLGLPGAEQGELPPLPADAVVIGQLRGPAFQTPVALAAVPGGNFQIPPLPLPGIYTLENIRLMSGGAVIVEGNPSTVRLEVIDKVLVSQVTSRPLTADEIKQKGIAVDPDNYQVVNFTVAFGLQDEVVEIEMPMIFPANNSAGVPGLPLYPIPSVGATAPPQEGILPSLAQTLKVPDVSISGFSLSIDDPERKLPKLVTPLPGVVIIPGNIAYLNQFFSVILKVSNVAPGYSNLEVRDLKATIVLPKGEDNVLDSLDDPLRMAKVGDPPVTQPKLQPVVYAGPDGKLKTEDDINTLAPQQSGDAEYLVEGRRQGIHTVEMEITGTLYGLPDGPVPVKGRAVGVVEVRDPQFALTINHPATVSAGEEYDLLVTVANISTTPANFVSLNLLPRSISGAELLSSSSVQIETIGAGDAETVTFRLRALKTGTVIANSIAADGVSGKFELRTAVGELGIPLSPTSLVLPPAAKGLPDSLRLAGVALLNQAFALASSPTTPEGLLPMGRSVIYDDAASLAATGQRIHMGEPLAAAARDLALDFLGNNYARLDQRFQGARLATVQSDYRGFDQLMRRSRRGTAFRDVIGSLWSVPIQANGALAFQQDFAEAVASRPAHLSVMVGADTGGAQAILNLADPAGRRLGITQPGGEVVQDIAFGGYFTPVRETDGRAVHYALVSTPASGAWTAEVVGTGSGAVDIGLVIPGTGGLQRVTFEDVALVAGSRARVLFTVGATNPEIRLIVDRDGDGFVDETLSPTVNEAVVDRAPSVISAVQIWTGNKDATKYGQVIGVLFSEEVDAASAQSEAEKETITKYAVDENLVGGVRIQADNRVVLLALRDGVGPYVDRTLTVSNVVDLRGNVMAPLIQSVPIQPKIIGARLSGTVRRADGTPVPFAKIALSQLEQDINDEKYWELVSAKNTDAQGRYSFDYVRQVPLKIQALDLVTNEQNYAGTSARFEGQHVLLDIILLGNGSVTGRVYGPDGTTPLAGAYVKMRSLTLYDDSGTPLNAVTQTGADGSYFIGGVPVGAFQLEAVHQQTRVKTQIASNMPVAGTVLTQTLVLLPVDRPLETGSVVGQVFRADGVTPAVGVPIYSSYGGYTETNASGAYRFDTVPVGDVSLRAIDAVNLEQADVRTTVVASSTVTANLILFGGSGTVRGAVFEDNGTPAAGISIYGGPAVVTTDASGQFVLENIPVGTRQLTALDPVRNRTVQKGVHIANDGDEAIVQFVMPARGIISGRVFEAGGTVPAPNVKVIIYGSGVYKTFTNDKGEYTVENMPLGEYKVAAFLSDFSDGNIALGKLVYNNQVQRIDVVFKGRGKAVTGIVYDDDGKTPLGAQVGLGELKVKFGLLAPPENPGCLGTIDLGNGQSLQLPPCETVPVDFEFIQRARRVNSDPSTGLFTFTTPFVGPILVEAANAFSPQIVSVKSEVPAPNATVPVTLSLLSTGAITGTVFYPDGTPVGPNVIVQFNSGLIGDVAVRTDEGGNFSFPLVNPSVFELIASDPVSGLTGRSSGTVATGQTAYIPIKLLREGSVAITVIGADALPIAGADVVLREGHYPARVREGRTDNNGQITFAGGDSVSEGLFSVTAYDRTRGVYGSASGTVPGVATSVDGHVAMTVTVPNAAATVVGRFQRINGTGIPNARVLMTGASGQLFTTTEADGYFQFDGVLKGNFQLSAEDPTTGRRGAASGVVSTNNVTVTVNMVEQALGTVTGVVKRMPEDQPLAGLQVTLFSSAAGRNRMTTTGTDGSYSFPGVPSGQFTLVAEDPYDSSIRVSASGVLTTEGQIATVNMTYTRPLVGRVEGQIFNADGSPAGAVSVYASPSGIRATSTITGYYSMHNVPLGKVDLVARPALGQRAGVGSGTLGFDGDVEVIDITLIGQGTLYGQVVDGGNNPVGLAEVSVQRRSDGLPVSYTANTQADTSGRFTVTNVLVGDISVTARQASTNLAGVVTGTLATDGGVLDLQVQLEPFGVVTGTVVRENGAAAPLMGLELSRTGVTYYGSSREDGSFTFENVKLGTYTLYIFDPLGKGIAKTTVTVSAQGQIVDLGTLTLDTAPPAVATITPANGAINVPVNQPIIVTFTEPVKASTINATNLIVTSAGKTVTGTWSLDAAAKVATFVPGVPFRDFTTYSLRIKKDILDLVDRPMEQEFVSSFTIADETPPTVTSRSPISGAFNVQLNTPIRIAFSEAIDPNAIVGPPVQVFQNGQPMSGTTSFILDNTVLVFVPDPNWSANAVVRVDLAAMPDIYGNKLPAHSYTFDTLDLIAPVIQAMTAPSGTTVLAGDVVKVVAEVDQTNDTAYVEFFVNGQSRLVDDIAPYEFNLPVPANASSDLTVAARASDRVGNVSEQSALTITVQSDTKPQVAISQPLSGTVVSTGSRITVTVGAYDDRGLAQIYYQVTGAASANGQVTVTPTVTSRTVDFAVDVPVNAVPGSRIELKASAVDTRGQSSDIATAYLVVGDSTAPTVFFTAPAPNTQVTPGEDVAVTVSATDNGPLGSIRLQASGVASFDETRVITTTQTLVSTTFQVPVAASARPTETLVLVAQATDTAGNPARPVTLTLPVRDTIAPSVQVVVDNAAREVLPGQTISFTVAATDETAVARLGYQIDGAFVVTGTRTITPAKADASTIFTATVPATVTAGSVFTVTGTAADNSNNSAASAPVQVAVVDDTVPLATITSIEPDLTVESGSMLTVTVDAADDQGLAEIRLRTGGALNSLQSITTGPVLTTTAVFTVAVPVNTPVGQSLVITAEAVDSRGQLGASTPATVTVTDKTAPAVLISSPSWWVQVVPGQNLTVRTYATDNTAVARVHLTVTGAVSLTATQVVSPLAQSVYNDFTFTVPAEATASDRITLTVQSEDAAGNLSELVSQGHSIKDIRQPVVTTSVSTTEAVPGRSVEVTVTAEDEMKVTWLGLSVSGAMTTTYNNFVSPASSPVSRTFNLWIPVALKAGDQIVLTGSAKDPSGNVGQAAPVTLTVVAPGGAVSGTVTRLATGAAMAGVDVIVDAYYQVFTATTDANGFYLVDGLVDGYIDVTAVDPVTGLRGRAATYIDETNPTPVLDLAITERPVVTVTEPISGVNVTENTELPITVDAFDDLEVDLIEVRVNDEVIFDINVGGEGGVGLPYTFPYYRVPTGSPSLTIVARAYDFDGNEGNSEPVVVNVTADAQTTVVGRVIDESGQPVEGATVDVSGQITVTDAAGRFVLPDIPTIWGDVTAIVRITVNGLPLQGSSAPTTPVPGGTTDLGDIVVKLSKVWDGGAGTTNWHDAANWNDDIAPNANDDVYIPITATVTIKADVNVNSLRSDGTLTLASGLNLFYPSVFNGDLTLASGALLYSSTDITTTGIVTWSGGTLSGPGRTTVLNRMVIDTNAHHMDSHTLVNRGVVSWTGGALRLYYGAAIENMAGATFELRSPDTIYHYNGLGAAPRIRNDGTLVKQVANITYFDVALDNSGVLTVAEGTLRLSREIVHTGAIDIQAGANLELYSQVSSTFEAGSTVSGAGNLYVTPNFASSINVRGAVTVSGLVRVEGNGFNVEDGALFTVDRLWLNGGTLAGSGTITVSDVLTWTSGTMAGPGRTVATNQVVMDTNTRYLYERTLETRGHTIWAGTIRGYRGGVWHNLPGAVIEARNDASYVYYNSDGARPVLFNEGLLTKSEGANVALTSATITNTGTLNVITGTLQFAAGSYHAGALQVDAGAVLDLSTGTHEIANSATVTATGVLRFSSGATTVAGRVIANNRIEVPGGNLTFVAGSTLEAAGSTLNISGGTAKFDTGAAIEVATLDMSAGTLTGADTLTATGLFKWGGGTLDGGGRTVAPGQLVINGNIHYLRNRVLENGGTALWTASAIRANNGGVVRNLAGGTFTVQEGVQYAYYNGEAPIPGFENQGGLIFDIASGLTFDMGGLFTNSGTVTVNRGTLRVAQATTNTGAIVVEAGGVYDVRSNLTLESGSVVTGTGTVKLAAGTTTVNGSYAFPGRTEIAGGTLSIPEGAAVTVTKLELSSGTLQGNGAVTVSELFTWTGGTMTGAGQTVVTGAASLGGLTKDLNGRTLAIAGTAVWSGGNLRANNGAVVHIQPGGTLEAQSAATFEYLNNQGVRPTLRVDGLLVKSGTGEASIYATVDNTGEVRVTGGTLYIRAGGTSTALMNAAAGGTLKFGANYALAPSSSVVGGGTLEVAAGTVTVEGTYAVSGKTLLSGGTMTVEATSLLADLGTLVHLNGGGLTLRTGKPVTISRLHLQSTSSTLNNSDEISITGVFTWTAGKLTGTGRTVSLGQAVLESTNSKTLDAHRFDNGGALLWSGGDWYASNGSTITNRAGGTFDVQAANNLTYSGATVPVFNNEGAFTKTTNAGQLQLLAKLNNAGTVAVQAGTMRLTQGGSVTGHYQVGSGATLDFAGQTSTLAPTASVTGDGVVKVSSGTVLVDGTYNVAGRTEQSGGTLTFNVTSTLVSLGGQLTLSNGTLNLNSGEAVALSQITMSNGTLSGSDAITMTGTMTWTAGTVSGTGPFYNTGQLLLSGTSGKVLSGRILENSASIVWSAGDWYLSNGGTLLNLPGATVDIQTNNQLTYSGVVLPTVINQGLIRKSAGASVNPVYGTITNGGTVQVLAGGLRFFTSYAQSGGVTEMNGGHLQADKPIQLHGGTLSGRGIITGSLVNSGTVTILPLGSALRITANYTQQPSGTLVVGIQGTDPSTGYDRLQVGGQAVLNGVLSVQRPTGYVPASGESFTVLSYGSRNGQFADIQGLDLGNGSTLTPVYNATDLTLQVESQAAGSNSTLLQDGAGMSYVASCEATVTAGVTGVSAAADGAMMEPVAELHALYVNGQPFPCVGADQVAAANAPALTYGPVVIDGIEVIRQLYVPGDSNFVRYVEVLYNPNTAPRTVAVEIAGALVAGPATRVLENPGETGAPYAIVDGGLQGPSDQPVMVYVFGDSEASAVPEASFADGSGQFAYRWHELTLEPGEKVLLVYFAAHQPAGDTAAAEAQAQQLATLDDPAYLAGIPADALAQVANFAAAPVDRPAETPEEQPVEIPVELPTEQPEEQQPVEIPVEQPTEQPVEHPGGEVELFQLYLPAIQNGSSSADIQAFSGGEGAAAPVAGEQVVPVAGEHGGEDSPTATPAPEMPLVVPVGTPAPQPGTEDLESDGTVSAAPAEENGEERAETQYAPLFLPLISGGDLTPAASGVPVDGLDGTTQQVITP